MSVGLTRLAESMAREGRGSTDEVLVNRDIRLNIVAEGVHGVRITATCLGSGDTAEDAALPRES